MRWFGVTDTVAACPECDSGSVHMNSPGGHNVENDGGKYRCAKCKEQFEEYDERERREGCAPGHTRRGLAGRLQHADPDEVRR